MIGGDMNLYTAGRYKPKTKTGFANKKTALQTLKNIKRYSIPYQKQVVITMYNRAKYHPYKTEDMSEAMKVYSRWMKKFNISSKTKKNTKTKKTKMTKNSYL